MKYKVCLIKVSNRSQPAHLISDFFDKKDIVNQNNPIFNFHLKRIVFDITPPFRIFPRNKIICDKITTYQKVSKKGNTIAVITPIINYSIKRTVFNLHSLSSNFFNTKEQFQPKHRRSEFFDIASIFPNLITQNIFQHKTF